MRLAALGFLILILLGGGLVYLATPAAGSIFEPEAIIAQDGSQWMAIVGDSSVTGAATHPSFKASWTTLLGHAMGLATGGFRRQHQGAHFSDYAQPEWFHIQEPVEPLTRVLYSSADREDAHDDHFETQMYWEGKASTRVDTEEFSFGYLIGRRLGIPARQIVNVGQDGTSIETMADQFDRILEVGSPTLPPLVLVSYVANDFCDPLIFDDTVERFKNEYQQEIREQFAWIAQLPANDNGTRIVVLAPLDVATLIVNRELQSQIVELEGRQVSCGEFHKPSAAIGFAARWLQGILIHECTAILDPSRDLQVTQKKVRELQEAEIEVLRHAIADFNASAKNGLSMQLADSIREIDFQKGDLAGDCFHPSLGGHTRIAVQLLTHELKSFALFKPSLEPDSAK